MYCPVLELIKQLYLCEIRTNANLVRHTCPRVKIQLENIYCAKSYFEIMSVICFALLQHKEEPPLWIKPLFCRQVVLFITGIALLFGRWHIMGSTPPVFQLVDNPASFEESLIMRVSSAQFTYTILKSCFIFPFHSQRRPNSLKKEP